MKIKTRLSLLIFMPFLFLCLGGSWLPENSVSITLEYNGKVWKWSDENVLASTTVFEHYGQFQRNNRMKAGFERVKIIKKLVKMGFSYDEAFEYCFKGILPKIYQICKTINKNPVDAKLKFTPNKAPFFIFSKEHIGYNIKRENIYKTILSQLENNNNVFIKLEPEILSPKVTLEDLKPLTSLKSKFSTSFETSGANRKHNVRKSLSCFNGMVLEPGVEYSFNKITKRRTIENGYLPANIILNEEYTEGIGGGVCQTSTTLYNALLLAGVDVLESHPHSLKSSYVKEGFDAMVNYGSSDLRWKNSSTTPMFVRTWSTDKDVFVEIYGKKDENEFTIKRYSEVVKIIKPKKTKTIVDLNGDYADKVYFEDETWVKSNSKDGSQVNSYLEFWKGDKFVSRKLIRKQTYKAVQGIIIKGAHKRVIQNEMQNENLDLPKIDEIALKT